MTSSLHHAPLFSLPSTFYAGYNIYVVAIGRYLFGFSIKTEEMGPNSSYLKYTRVNGLQLS